MISIAMFTSICLSPAAGQPYSLVYPHCSYPKKTKDRTIKSLLLHVLVFVPFVCPVEPQTYRFIVEVNQNRASTSQIFSIKTEPGTLSAMPMTDGRSVKNEPSHISSTNGYSGSGSPTDDTPCRRNKLQIITLMYGTGGGNYSRSTGPEGHDQSFNSRSEKSHYPYDNDHNDENSGRPANSRHSLEENCHEQPCCHRKGHCIFAPSTITQCRSSSGDSFAYRTDVYLQTGDQASGSVSHPDEGPTVVSRADSTTGPALTLNPPPAKKQRRAGSKKYRCDHPGCEKLFISQGSLKTHKSQYHTGERNCPECQKTRPNAQALSVHKSLYHTGEQTCPKCQKTLPNAQALSNHKRKDHTPEQSCPECQKTLPNAKALSVHKSKYHTGEQSCPECQKTLPNGQALTYHKRKDHTEGQTCPECQKTLPNTQALSNHKSQHHTGERTCPECQKTLPNPQALSYHKRKDHTPEQTCPECQKILPNVQALWNHKRKDHTPEQTCPECQKTLPNAQALSDHRRRHRKRKLDDAKSSD
ncbi:C2H2-type zinc finger protein [Endozoicomonas sp. ISHI1]|uniref:C2H2-type zinc finger protein n=1 Tax=Endozoicomonas sp. ISHI1 TaxID=2825882 RepID=UPI0021486B8D|nr:C2H2-type zinc finger protein [Endozoicomonas sp. ISHI1]